MIMRKLYFVPLSSDTRDICRMLILLHYTSATLRMKNNDQNWIWKKKFGCNWKKSLEFRFKQESKISNNHEMKLSPPNLSKIVSRAIKILKFPNNMSSGENSNFNQ